MSEFLDYNGLKHFATYIINKINSSAGVLGVRSFKGRMGNVEPQSGDYTADMVGAVPTSRTINGKPLTNDITIEVEAPENDGVTSFNSRKGDVLPQSGDYTASMIGAVPTSRTINGKALSSNIILTLDNISTSGRNIQLITYSGTGKNGSDYPNSLTFSFPPKMVFWFIKNDQSQDTTKYFHYMTAFIPIISDSDRYSWCVTEYMTTSYKYYLGPNGGYAKLDSSGKTLYWYNVTSGGGATGDKNQLNSSGYTYYVVAFG